jgi:hypothetical protein
MEGMLTICGSAEGVVINIWVMQDYKAQVWESKYRIHLLLREPPCPLSSLKGLFKVAVVNERELWIQFPDADLKLFDIDGKLIGNTRSGLEFWTLTSHFLQDAALTSQGCCLRCSSLKQQEQRELRHRHALQPPRAGAPVVATREKVRGGSCLCRVCCRCPRAERREGHAKWFAFIIRFSLVLGSQYSDAIKSQLQHSPLK